MITAASVIRNMQEREHREKMVKLSPKERTDLLLKLLEDCPGILREEDVKKILEMPGYKHEPIEPIE